MVIATVIDRLVDACGLSHREATVWLDTSNRLLGGRTPRQAVDRGICQNQLREALDRIQDPPERRKRAGSRLAPEPGPLSAD